MTPRLSHVHLMCCCQFSSVASVTYPDVYGAFVNYIDVIDLDLSWIVSARCWVDTNFYDELLGTTIGPLAVAGLVLLSFKVRSRKCPAGDQERRSRINHTHTAFMYLISFLIYSRVSSTIFQVCLPKMNSMREHALNVCTTLYDTGDKCSGEGCHFFDLAAGASKPKNPFVGRAGIGTWLEPGRILAPRISPFPKLSSPGTPPCSRCTHAMSWTTAHPFSVLTIAFSASLRNTRSTWHTPVSCASCTRLVSRSATRLFSTGLGIVSSLRTGPFVIVPRRYERCGPRTAGRCTTTRSSSAFAG